MASSEKPITAILSLPPISSMKVFAALMASIIVFPFMLPLVSRTSTIPIGSFISPIFAKSKSLTGSVFSVMVKLLASRLLSPRKEPALKLR